MYCTVEKVQAPWSKRDDKKWMTESVVYLTKVKDIKRHSMLKIKRRRRDDGVMTTNGFEKKAITTTTPSKQH